MLLPSIGVFSALALSFAALSIVGVVAVSSTIFPSKNTAKLMPSCPSDWSRTLFQASLPWLMSWWRSRRASSTGASSSHWPYPQSALGRWCLRQYAVQCRPVTTPTLLRQVDPSSLSSSSPQTGVIPKISKLHKTRQSPNAAPLSSRNRQFIIY